MKEFFLLTNAFTILNIVILASILIFRKNNAAANIILAFVIIDPGLNFINNILIQSGAIFHVPFFLFIFQGTMLLYAPLVLAYVYLMTGNSFKWVSILNFLTLGAILLDVYYAVSFYQLDKASQITYLQGLTNGNYPKDQEMLNNIFVLIMLAYFVVALIKIRKQRKSAFEFFSDIEKLKLNYIRWFVILLTSLNIALTISYAAFPTPIVEYFGIPLIIIIIYIYVVAYAFNRSAVLSHTEYCTFKENSGSMKAFARMEEPRCKEIAELKKNKGKYKLTEMEMDLNYKKINDYLKSSKPYLDPNINLTKFSSDLEACSHNISLTINYKFGKNFFDLINSLRIDHAKQMLLELDQSQYTIESVSMASGFSTTSSFYRAFKKHTNCTPTEYLKKMRVFSN
jgi:AraC-like DNA-binding protein